MAEMIFRLECQKWCYRMEKLKRTDFGLYLLEV